MNTKRGLAKRGSVAAIAVGLIAGSFAWASSPQGAGAVSRGTMVIDSTDTVTLVGPKLPPGAPLSAAKPPYPEECGPGYSALGESTGAAPFATFCDFVPLSVSLPANIDPADDVKLTLTLTWPQANTVACSDNHNLTNQPPPGEVCNGNPSTNLDFWLWDNKQNISGKVPVPQFDGPTTKWTPAEVLSEYTMLKAGTGTFRPAKIELNNPVLNKQAGGINYIVLVMNFNSEVSPQTSGPCPVSGGVPGCYILRGKLTVTKGESRTEKTEPTLPETPFIPPAVPGNVTPPSAPVDLSPVVGPLAPTPTPVNFGATVLPPPQAAAEPDPVVLGAVEANIDPLLQSIKESNLEDELIVPDLEVAVSEEPPPPIPSGTAVAASMTALPILAAGAVVVFLIRRRAAFRLS